MPRPYPMPIPTDTFWNIRKLNLVFAISTFFMLVTFVWSIVQDYGKSWRGPQIASRVWESALTRDKIEEELTPEKKAKLDDLSTFAGSLASAVNSGNVDFASFSKQAQDIERKHATILTESEKQSLGKVRNVLESPAQQQKLKQHTAAIGEMRKHLSDISTREFSLNNVRAEYNVEMVHLEDARTRGDTAEIRELQEKLAKIDKRVLPPSKSIKEEEERIAGLKRRTAELRQQRLDATGPIDELRRLVAKLGGDIELMRKKVKSLEPDSLLGRISAHIRAAPLMGFINPSERVRQLVLPDILTDVSFMKIETLDRCTTCHVHIERPDFSEANILAYLEEQLAKGRKYRLPEIAPGGQPTAAAPGALAMPEFFHHHANLLIPAQAMRSAAKLEPITSAIGPQGIRVKFQRRSIDNFTYDPALAAGGAEHGSTELAEVHDKRAQQDAILCHAIDILLKYPAADKGAIKTVAPDVEAEIPAAPADPGKLDAAREAAIAYVLELSRGLRAQLESDAFELLEERYRYALTERVNGFRKQIGFAALDPSPVLLAHPRLDLYAAVDSKHNMEEIGCTACHDGSGQETDFVLAAHTARPIWVDAGSGMPVLVEQIVTPPASANHNGNGHAEDLSDMREVVLEDVTSLHIGHAPTTQPATQPGAPAAAHAAHGNSHSAPKAQADGGAVMYLDPLTGTERRAVSQYDYWAKKYEGESGTTFATVNHMWDWPMRPREYRQANCARCHTNIHDIRDEAPVLYEGRVLFAKMGCANCHQMDSILPDEPAENALALDGAAQPALTLRRKVGPDLRQVASKLSAAFLDSWIWAPKSFRPSTQMPHFFMLENNSSDEEIRRTMQEVLSIRTYLLKTSTVKSPGESQVLRDPAYAMPQPAAEGSDEQKEAIARGRILFIGLEGSAANPQGIIDRQGGVGCIGCHTNLNEVGQKWIVEDFLKNADFVEQVRTKLKKPRPTRTELVREATARYNKMTYQERHVYAMENFAEPMGANTIPRYPDNTPKPIFQHHGPELSGIGTKLTSGRNKAEARRWLYQWLIDPRHYSANTVMPRLRLTAQDALDLTEYLLAQRRRQSATVADPWKAIEIKPDPAKATQLVAMFLRSQASERQAREMAASDAEMKNQVVSILKTQLRKDASAADAMADTMPLDEKQRFFLGFRLINHYGCMNCHAINGMETAASPCANLSDWGQKGIDKLDYGYVSHHKVEELSATQGKVAKVPLVNSFSVDATTRLVDAVNKRQWDAHLSEPISAAWPHIGHTRSDWLTYKLKNSRIYDRGKNLLDPARKVDPNGKPALDESGDPILERDGKPYDKLRMPTFFFNQEQVEALVTFVLSNRDRLVTPRLIQRTNPQETRDVALGRQIAEKYNCIACHRIEANEPSVQQYWNQGLFDKTELTAKAPPSLRSEGHRVQHAWLFNFLKNVDHEGTLQREGEAERVKMRPQPFIRMPSFPLRDDEATALAAYFSAISNKEARNLATLIKPILDDAARELKESNIEVEDPDQLWPADDWHARPKFATAAAKLREWALTHTLLKPTEFAIDNDADSLARAYKLALYDARFVARSFPGRYPFAEFPRPAPSEERFKKGEKLYHLLQCQTCHVVGDERNPGVNQQPKAPNFLLTARRIQRSWARHWVQEPQTIQPGNPMASIFFSGRGVQALTDPSKLIYSLDGLPHITSSPTPEVAMAIQLEFGGTVDQQIDLVLDFIYAASLRGYTSINPPEGEPKPTPLPPPPTTRSANAATAPVTAPATRPAATGPAGTRPATTQVAVADPKAYGLPIIPGITGPLPEMRPITPATPATPAAGPAVAAAGSGSITGKVILQGQPPPARKINVGATPQCANQHPGGSITDDVVAVAADGAIRNVIVMIKNIPKGPHAVPKVAAELDQKGCWYTPRVLPMMVGQRVIAKNSDPFLHNIHTLPALNPSDNFAQSNIDPGKPLRTPIKVETYKVKCDVHPWMVSTFVVLDHPYFAATKADGLFEIKGLPPGKYTLTTWHELGEKIPPVEQEVTVESDKPAEVKLTLTIAE